MKGEICMKNLIVYSSKTGNTKKLAEALYEHISGPKEIFPVSEAPDPEGYTFVGAGFRIENGEPDAAMQEYLKKIIEDCQLFLFATHASQRGSETIKNAMKIARELPHGTRIVGEYECLGEVSESALEEAKKQQPVPAWVADAEAAKGHPDKEDIQEMLKLIESLDLPA